MVRPTYATVGRCLRSITLVAPLIFHNCPVVLTNGVPTEPSVARPCTGSTQQRSGIRAVEVEAGTGMRVHFVTLSHAGHARELSVDGHGGIYGILGRG